MITILLMISNIYLLLRLRLIKIKDPFIFDNDSFSKIIKNHPNKFLREVRSGQCIRNHDGELYILFFSNERFNYCRLPSPYQEDWYLFNLNTGRRGWFS